MRRAPGCKDGLKSLRGEAGECVCVCVCTCIHVTVHTAAGVCLTAV